MIEENFGYTEKENNGAPVFDEGQEKLTKKIRRAGDRMAVMPKRFLWDKKNGEVPVPFTVDDSQFSSSEKAVIESAFKDIEDVTCIR